MDINDIRGQVVERIYLIPDSSEGQLGYVWCDDPAPGIGMDPGEAVEYVRKDVADARIAELERIAAQFKAAALKASTNGYGQDEVHHDDSWIDELDEALRKIQIYDAKRAKAA
ncbi:hypothetical protein [Vreelandella venusta]|uniref:hypothetical protein n=1 Tax=Vreelandella venusta TaxID=44935 RepID=UPI002010240D|nr:hypothetical protein [Halomonas venusta]UQI42706.1 hypothetical protein M3L73_10770 [Halomonas venusta]